MSGFCAAQLLTMSHECHMKGISVPENSEKKWQTAGVDRGRAEALARDCHLPLTIAALLLRRGIAAKEEVRHFFSATLAELPSPFLLKGMDTAVATIAAVFEEKRPLVVYGDYDADGTTGAALLSLFLRDCGFVEVHTCQPLRLQEGYGLHRAALERNLPVSLLERKPLLITVDCGIANREEVAQLKGQGWSVIVTDHHLPPVDVPLTADAIIDPLQEGCLFPDKNLAGVGVALYLAMGIRKDFRDRGLFGQGKGEPNLKEYLDLVALGTVADMVPVAGVNRILVKAGLETLARTRRSGLLELVRVARINSQEISCEDIGFRLGPRLNAAGRMGDAKRALELLVTENSGRAAALALEINGENETRKSLITTLIDEAEIQAAAALEKGRQGLVLAGKDWHPGIVGIGAARMVEKYYRPTLMFALQKDGTAKGSGRSLPGLNLHEILVELQDLFTSFGGHEAAVGLSLPLTRLAELEKRFEEGLARRLCPEMLVPGLVCEWQEKENEVFSQDFLAWYPRLAPFGQGNPEPLFRVRAGLNQPRLVGGKHLKFNLKVNGASYEGIAFGFAAMLPQATQGQEFDIAFHWRINTFQGRLCWQIVAQEFRVTTD